MAYDSEPRRREGPLSTDVQNAVRIACENATGWIEGHISDSRVLGEAYYEGQTRLLPIPGRSKVTVTVARDAIKAVLTSIGRVFTQTDTIVEFASDDEFDQAVCKEMTLYANNVFHKYGGYVGLMEAATDALKSRAGILLVRLDQKEVKLPNIQSEDYEDSATSDEIQGGEAEFAMEVPDQEQAPPQQNGKPPNKKPKKEKQEPLYRNSWSLECVPPEDFILDEHATCIENARLVGLRKPMSIAEIRKCTRMLNDKYIEQEFSMENLYSLSPGDDSSQLRNEANRRRRFDVLEYDENPSERATKRVLFTELWIRIDRHDTGDAELRHMICCGPNYEIYYDAPIQCVPVAMFKADLQPHVPFPISMAEDLVQDQDGQTSILRSIIDNVALVNSPRTLINDGITNLEDAKKTDIGTMIRVSGPLDQAMRELTTPFSAGETLPVLEYMRTVSESRSGVTKLSQGIDPNALQATSRIAANAAVQGGDARIELICRNLAETGVKALFTAIIRVAMYEMKGNQSILMPDGKFKSISPGMWHDQVAVNVTVGMGNGKIEEKMQALQQLLAMQQDVFKTYGPGNPFVTWDNIRNTQKAMLRLSGIKTIGDFLPQVPAEAEKDFQNKQQEKQQAQQNQQNQPPPQSQSPDVVGAAKVKAESDMQVNQAKIQAQQQADQAKMNLESQKLMAQLQERHQLETMDLQAKLQSQMQIAQLEADQRRDAANQQFAVQAFAAQMDAQTQQQVAMQNLQNDQVQIQMQQQQMAHDQQLAQQQAAQQQMQGPQP